jgi:tetratricopeptide (TPR) repeat protein
LRAAFEWSRENSDIGLAATITSSLQPLWLNGGRIREGLTWVNRILSEDDVSRLKSTPALYARALTDKAMLDAWGGISASMDQPQQALQIAREIDDPTLLTRALTACGHIAASGDNPRVAGEYFTEAIGLARALGDTSLLSHILLWQAQAASVAGDPTTARAAIEEVRDLGNSTGDMSNWRASRQNLGWALLMQGDLRGSVDQFSAGIAESEEAHDPIWKVAGLQGLSGPRFFPGPRRPSKSPPTSVIFCWVWAIRRWG